MAHDFSLDDHFTVSGEEATSLVNTLVQDLKVKSRVRHGKTPEDPSYLGPPRRVAVVVMYATGEIGVTTGWSVTSVPKQGGTLALEGDDADQSDRS